jgi:membrane-associated phospholipid phosphatase
MSEQPGGAVGTGPMLSLGRWAWGCVTVGALFWAAGLLLWAQQSRGASLDHTALLFFEPLRHTHGPLVGAARWLTSYGMPSITLAYVALLLLGKRFGGLALPAGVYLLVIFSLGVSGIAGDLIKEALARPRPIVTYAGEVSVLSQAATPALPSGHATKSLALALPLLFLVPGRSHPLRAVKVLVLIMALGVGISRVVLGAHYVSDVLAGMGTALAGLPPSMFLANLILKRAGPEKLGRLQLVWGFLLVVLTCILVLM